MSDIGNKEIFSRNLRAIMDRLGKDRTQVCADLDFKYTTFADWYNGNKYPRIDKIEMLANYFGVLKSALIEEDGAARVLPANILPMPAAVSRPRLGSIACGDPILAEQNIEGYDQVPDYIKCDFTLLCKGDSMTGARIYDGDVVCIRQQPTVENGQIAAVLVDGDEATLKRFYYENDTVTLQAANPAYPPRVFTGEDASKVRVLGLATHFISKVV